MWISCAQQECQERRAQRKSDPVAESDLVDADVGGPGNGETRDGLFWLGCVQGCTVWAHEYTVINADIRASAIIRKKRQRQQHLCQTRLPHDC